MPTVEIDYNPEFSKEKLVAILKNDLTRRYEIFVGNWFQGKCIIISQNGWVGAAINIRQQSRKRRTQLEVKPTVPRGRSMVVALMIIFGVSFAAVALIINHIFPVYAAIAYMVFVGTVSILGQYWRGKSQLAVIEIAGLLEISNDLAPPQTGRSRAA